MKKILTLFLCTWIALSALEPGKNYDFFQRNGQNVLGAELMPLEPYYALKYLVLVLVVTEVLRLRVAFVPAIACHCSPGELERQQDEQSNGEPTTHAK